MDYHVNRYNSKLLATHWSKWITDIINEEGNAYFLTFMFHPLPGNRENQIRMMSRDIGAFYKRLLMRALRGPRSELHQNKRPLLFASPDLPIYKRIKDPIENITINEGLHMHAIAIIRPGTRRIKLPLHHHIAKKDAQYRLHTKIRTIHAVPIDKTPEKVTQYALKAIGRHFDEDYISIWPGPRPKARQPKWIDHYID